MDTELSCELIDRTRLRASNVLPHGDVDSLEDATRYRPQVAIPHAKGVHRVRREDRHILAVTGSRRDATDGAYSRSDDAIRAPFRQATSEYQAGT